MVTQDLEHQDKPTLRLPNDAAGLELAPIDSARQFPGPIATILSHVMPGADERLLFRRIQPKFAWRHDDHETSLPVEQMHRPCAVRAPLDLDRERVDVG